MLGVETGVSERVEELPSVYVLVAVQPCALVTVAVKTPVTLEVVMLVVEPLDQMKV